MFKIISIGKVSKQQIYCPVGIDAKKYINWSENVHSEIFEMIGNNINLSQDNFDEFYNERFKILHDKLCEILNAKSSNDVEDDDEQ